ncbi:hypothetical protein Tco_0194085 [Tanacetum coccineum]
MPERLPKLQGGYVELPISLPALDEVQRWETLTINTLTMEQYIVVTHGNQGPSVIKLEISNNRVLDIVSFFSTPGVSHDVIMLRVFPITLIGSAKRWIDRLPSGSINTWDLLEKAFIQRYCPPSKTAKQLEEIHNFK